MVAVLFIDLDGFKAVNDRLGHVTGDHFLKVVAVRLRERVRPSDLVARIGGDEFAIVVPRLSKAEHAAEIAQDIVEGCLRPYQVDGKELYASASIGVALSPLDATDADGLIRAADAAMYKAKKDGGASFRFYTTSLRSGVCARHAPERNEFTLHYQPIVISSGQAVAFEALPPSSSAEQTTSLRPRM